MVTTMVVAHIAAAEGEKETGALQDWPMFKCCTNDEQERETIPERHRPAEGGGKQGGGLRVSFRGEFAQLRVDEGCDGELVA